MPLLSFLRKKLDCSCRLLVCCGISGAIFTIAIYSYQIYVDGNFATTDWRSLPEIVSYNRDVRPVLSQNCFRCHGQDAVNRKAGLRLDIPEMAYGELLKSRGKHAIIPGNPGKSELFRRVTASDVEERMPPTDTHLTLSKRDIALLGRWIRQGASYEGHWAYVPPKESTPRPTPWPGTPSLW